MRALAVLVVCCLVLPALAGPLQTAMKRFQSNAGRCVILDAGESQECQGTVDGVEATPGTSCPFKLSNNSIVEYICHDSGLWIERSKDTMVHQHREKRFPFVIVFAAAAVFCFFFCRTDSSRPHNNPPSIQCPSLDPLWAKENETTVAVTWSKPKAHDAEDPNINSNVKQTYGVQNNSDQSAGDYSIQYEVKDSMNALAYCSFVVKVAVRLCNPLQYPEHGSLTCSPGLTLWGSHCKLTCDQGYQVQGPDVFICGKNEQWSPSNRPRCQPRECPSLPVVEHGFFRCLGPQQYRTMCFLGCASGFAPRQSVIACQDDGSFTAPGRCADNTKPEFSTGCPWDVETIAGRPGQLTPVMWTPPLATDNSGNVTLTSTMSPGDGFSLGFYRVVYTAADAEGNMASCSFRITVKTIKCPAPHFDKSGRLRVMQYSCPDGYVVGAVCDVTCSAGYPHLGAIQIECRLIQTSNPLSAEWSPINNTDPECQVLSCPLLHRPANGALACGAWSLGEFCTLTCNDQFDVPRGLTSPLFVCTTNGQGWNPNVTVPDCNKKRNPSQANIPNYIYFYNGDCSDDSTKASIQQLFLDILRNSSFKNACTNAPDCRPGKVSVSCGNRRRRETHKHRRSTQSILVEFNVTVSFMENLDEVVENVIQILEREAAQGYFDLTIEGVTYRASNFSTAPTLYDCPEGSKINLVTTTCAGCSRGTYYNATVDNCQDCPISSYADQGFSLSCTPCPQHSTTSAAGSKSKDDCIALCSPGHFSLSGLEPCQPCAAGSYQPDFGQISCLLCPSNHSTPTNASTSISSCVAMDTCLSSPCGNHHCDQGPRLGDFLCTCKYGWRGVTCQTPPDACQGHVCQNGATCIVITQNYTCSCASGFYGDFCQEPTTDGAYGPYGDWSQCSKTCGGGARSRQRSCDSPPPGPHGQACAGPRQEVETCNAQPCPVCPSLGRLFGVEFNCTENDDVTSCSVTCRVGLTFAEQPLEKYECGRATNYTWNHYSPDFPQGRIPECSPVKTPMTTVATVAVQYGSCQTMGSGNDVVYQIRTSVQRLDCVQKSVCTPEVNMTVCDVSSRTKRSTSNTGTVIVSLTMTYHGSTLDLTSLENNTLSSEALDYVNRLLSMEISAQTLANNSNNVLTVTVGGAVISPVSIDVSAQLYCPGGSIPTEGVCAVCPKGTKQEGNACVLCERGFYQGQSGQTTCQACPEGKSTPFLASTHLYNCSFDDPSSDKGNTGPAGDSSASQTLAIALGVVASVVVLAAAIPLSIYLYKSLKRRQRVSNSYVDLKPAPTPTLALSTLPPPYSAADA